MDGTAGTISLNQITSITDDYVNNGGNSDGIEH